MEGDKCQNYEKPRQHSVGRHGAAENRPTNVCGAGGGAHLDAKGQTVTIRKAMVDNSIISTHTGEITLARSDGRDEP